MQSLSPDAKHIQTNVTPRRLDSRSSWNRLGDQVGFGIIAQTFGRALLVTARPQSYRGRQVRGVAMVMNAAC